MAGSHHSVVFTELAPTPSASYVQGVDCGSIVYVSGQLGVDPQTGVLAGTAAAETSAALANIRAILEEARLGVGDVVKTTVFVTSLDDYKSMDDAYSRFFGERLPARSTIEVARLVGGATVEIEAIAVRTSG